MSKLIGKYMRVEKFKRSELESKINYNDPVHKLNT